MAPKKRELLLLERRGSEKRLRVTVPVAAAAAVAAVGVGTAALASPATRMLRKIVLVLLFLLRMCVPAASIHRVLANPHPIPSHLSNFYFFCFVLCVCVCRSERVTVVESISQIGRMVSKWINGSMILPPPPAKNYTVVLFSAKVQIFIFLPPMILAPFLLHILV